MDQATGLTPRQIVLLLAMFGASLFVGGVCFFALLAIGAGAPLSFAAASIPAMLVLFFLTLIRFALVYRSRSKQQRVIPK